MSSKRNESLVTSGQVTGQVTSVVIGPSAGHWKHLFRSYLVVSAEEEAVFSARELMYAGVVLGRKECGLECDIQASIRFGQSNASQQSVSNKA